MTIKGLDLIKDRMTDCRERMAKNKRNYARAAVIVDRWIQKNFRSEGGEVGGWEPLAKSTEATRRVGRKKDKGHKILQDTGQLKTRWKLNWNHKRAIVKSGVNYGHYHDSKESRRRLPRRQILPDEEHIIDPIRKIFKKHVDLSMRKADLD